MADQSASHPIALKVMRLARPKFALAHGLIADPSDETSTSIAEAITRRSGEEATPWPAGEFILAPQQFENIYLGETFTFYISCVNESPETLEAVEIKVELQTNNQKVALNCTLNGMALTAGESKGQVINHEVKELGQHILACSIAYKTNSTPGPQYFRKFFKFPVAKPVDVRTTFYNTEDNLSYDVFLEAQIENTSNGNMILEKVVLEPSEFYTSQPIVHHLEAEAVILLEPKDIMQYLFCLTPKNVGALPVKEVTNTGKLNIEWRTAIGEKGRLQTNSLQRMSPGYGDTRLTIERVPAEASIRQVFEVVCRIHNCCNRSLDLLLTFDALRQPGMVFACTSGKMLGQIPPNKHVDFVLELLPFAPGFQSISGIRVQDVFNKRVYEYDDVAQVFVN